VPEETTTFSATVTNATSAEPETTTLEPAPEETTTSSATVTNATSSAEPEITTLESAPEETTTSNATVAKATSSAEPETTTLESAPEVTTTSKVTVTKVTSSAEPETTTLESAPEETITSNVTVTNATSPAKPETTTQALSSTTVSSTISITQTPCNGENCLTSKPTIFTETPIITTTEYYSSNFSTQSHEPETTTNLSLDSVSTNSGDSTNPPANSTKSLTFGINTFLLLLVIIFLNVSYF
jgi:hypothetical protein